MTTIDDLKKNTGVLLNQYKLQNGKGYKNAFDENIDERNGYTDLSNITYRNKNEKLWKFDRNSFS